MGYDFPASSGTPIPVAADGVVVGRGENSSFGNMVIVQHHDPMSTNLKFTLYAHLFDLDRTPRVGTRVFKGQTIGPVGNTGQSRGAHLHLELISLEPGVAPWSVDQPWTGGSTLIGGRVGRLDPSVAANWGGIDVYQGEPIVSPQASFPVPELSLCFIDSFSPRCE